jgi:hypothetical protein
MLEKIAAYQENRFGHFETLEKIRKDRGTFIGEKLIADGKVEADDEMPEASSEEAPEEMSEEAPEEMPEEAAEEMPEEMPEEAEESPEAEAEEVAQEEEALEVSEEALEETPVEETKEEIQEDEVMKEEIVEEESEALVEENTSATSGTFTGYATNIVVDGSFTSELGQGNSSVKLALNEQASGSMTLEIFGTGMMDMNAELAITSPAKMNGNNLSITTKDDEGNPISVSATLSGNNLKGKIHIVSGGSKIVLDFVANK